MKKNELKPCNCDCSMPFAYNTNFIGVKIATTILCLGCRRKITRLTDTMAINAWNKRVSRTFTKGDKQCPEQKK